MTDPRPLLLLTRPRDQAGRFAEAFRARFGTAFDMALAPVMEIALGTDPIPLDGVGGLIFTSENGVAGFAAVSDDRRLPAYCVGDRTAQAARDAGLQARSAHGTAVDLVADIAADPPDGRLLHLRGAHARGNVCGKLCARGIKAEDRVVYTQRALPFEAEVLRAVARAPLTLIPLFSPRSAQMVSDRLRGTAGRLALVTMSAAVTEAWTGPAPIRLEQAARPDATAMLDSLERIIAAVTLP